MNAEFPGRGAHCAQSLSASMSSGSPAHNRRLSELPCSELQQRFTQALEDGAAEVFEMMVGAALLPPAQAMPSLRAEYTAMIGLAGDMCGVLSFRCSASSAALIASRMLGTSDDIGEASVRDALGEICNMVAGSCKSRLSELAPHCMLSVPTVVSGKDYHLYPLVDGVRTQVCKSLEGALVWMTLDLHSTQRG